MIMSQKKTNVLAICQREIPSALVGIIEPLKTLQAQNLCDFEFKETHKIGKEDFVKTDVLICIRGSEENDLEIVKECKRLGKCVIYFLDDDLLNVPESALSSGYFNNKTIRETIADIMKMCDCLWTTNKNIKNKYSQYFFKSVVINAPALLLDLLEDQTYERVHEDKGDSTITIGFSGGLDHKEFLERTLESPIKYIQSMYKNVKFEFMGANPNFLNKYNIEYIPYEHSHDRYGKMLINRNWDIALAPLKDSDFHSCKYFNKYLEYGAIGAVGLFSNVEPYKFVIKNEQNGILVDNTESDWINGIIKIIENKELRQTIKTNAREHLFKCFTREAIADEVLKSINELCSFKAPEIKKSNVKYNIRKNPYIITRLLNAIRTHKFYFPIFLIKRIILFLRTRF